MLRRGKSILSLILIALLNSVLTFAVVGCGSDSGGSPATVTDLGSVNGVITDTASALVSGVTVSCGGKTDTTGSDGIYSISDIGVGSKSISASMQGYQTFTGTVTITRGMDTAYNIQMTASISPSDTTAPSMPTGLAATTSSSTQIALTWTASTDDTAVTGYNIYRSSTKIASSTTTSYADAGLTAGTNYCYTVTAYDAAGNESTTSSQSCDTTQTVVVNTFVQSGIECYVDPTCTAANAGYSVRDVASGLCMSMGSCDNLWACSAAATGGTCGTGTTACTISPGCSQDVQTTLNGFCTNISSCSDRINRGGYQFDYIKYTSCYIDTACTAANAGYSVRDVESGLCIDTTSCDDLWACSAAAAGGTCGTGTTACTISPGCSQDVQTCSAGFCTAISGCSDRIYRTSLFNF